MNTKFRNAFRKFSSNPQQERGQSIVLIALNPGLAAHVRRDCG